MTTITPFTPSSQTPFQFQPELDGSLYTAIVTWCLFGRRYYINLFTLQGVRVFSLPLIGSPLDYDLSLTEGYFNSTLIFRAPSQQFEVSP